VFGGVAENRERNNTDQQLVRELNTAVSAYSDRVDDAQQEAVRVAKLPAVADALRQRDGAALRKFEQGHPGIVLSTGRKPMAPGTLTLANILVSVRRKNVGRVRYVVPERDLVRDLASDTDLADGQLGLLRGERLLLGEETVPLRSTPPRRESVDLRVGPRDTRAVAVQLPGQSREAALITLRDRSAITAAANRVRWLVIAIGLGLMGALLAIAYAVAPAIARSRLSRQQRDEAERVLAHLGDGVFVIDYHGVIRLWNQAAEAITGLRAKDVRGEKAKEAIPGWDTIAALVPVSDRPGEGEGPSSSETVPVDIDGRELWLSVVAVALDDDTVYAFRDATHDRRLEDLRTQFVATISHEIRTPLASLHGAAITLREHDLPPQTQDDLLEMIAEQSNRLAGLVEEILVAGQLDSGSLSVVADTFDPEELVRGVVTVAHSRVAEEREIEVTMPPVVPNVHGDGERTRQVLLNLIDNAIKYSPSGGQIDVRLTPVGDHLRFSVHDQGLGIPVGEQERIFDKFYRLDPDQRRGIGGTGLGLYICRELVRSMHGRIWVVSDPGKGTTFAFELPAEPLPAPV
jgi:two-component system, OmpR family, phosphate regulon sensor histidine kinase PhoR